MALRESFILELRKQLRSGREAEESSMSGCVCGRGFSGKGKQMENNGEIKLEGAARYPRGR